jgi:hypothetical protein
MCGEEEATQVKSPHLNVCGRPAPGFGVLCPVIAGATLTGVRAAEATAHIIVGQQPAAKAPATGAWPLAGHVLQNPTSTITEQASIVSIGADRRDHAQEFARHQY